VESLCPCLPCLSTRLLLVSQQTDLGLLSE